MKLEENSQKTIKMKYVCGEAQLSQIPIKLPGGQRGIAQTLNSGINTGQ